MIGPDDLLTLRTALLITLSILLIVVLWRRFRRQVLANDMPAFLHAELIGLELAYHPPRLYVQLRMPSEETIGTRLLDAEHTIFHTWEEQRLAPGPHTLERTLPTLTDGPYFLEMYTATQRTVRQFRLQQA